MFAGSNCNLTKHYYLNKFSLNMSDGINQKSSIDENPFNFSTQILDNIDTWKKDPSKKAFLESLLPFFSRLEESSFEIIPEFPWSSFLVSALELKELDSDTPLVNSEQWKTVVSQLDAKELIHLMHYLFMNPKILSSVPFGQASTLNISNGGTADHSFSTFGKLLMHAEGATNSRIVLRKNELADGIAGIYQSKPQGKPFPELPSAEIDDLIKRGSCIGRTLVVKDNEDSNMSIIMREKSIAYKFLRQGETVVEFCREQEMTNFFRKTQLFFSDLPEPVDIYRLKKIPEELLAKLPENINKDSPLIYKQKISAIYYEYLHGIDAEDTWSIGRKMFLVDSGLEMSLGHIPLFADLYHNEEVLRRYQPLIDLAPMERLGGGAGRLETPFLKTQWPNAGATGIRDVGDGNHLKSLVENPFEEAADLIKLKAGKMTYFLMNGLARLSLVDSLLIAARLDRQKKLDWQNEETLKSVANSLKEGQKWILQGFTGCSESECSQFIEGLPINWHRQAKQLIFWLQTGEAGYAKYLDAGKLPEGLYDSEVNISIDLKKCQNFIPLQGFFTEGHRDIGCYNGPLGLLEHEKGWHSISAMAVAVFYHKRAEIAEPQEKFISNAMRSESSHPHRLGKGKKRPFMVI